MARFQPLKLKQYAPIQERETKESQYWKAFTLTKETTFDGTPNCIHFNPRNASVYAVTGSNKVTIFDANNDAALRSISRFTDEAYSGKFRNDGKLIVAGDKSGYLKVFDVASKAVLRQLKRHSAAVRATGWTADGLHMLSGSDDKTAKKWDLATQQVVWENHTSGPVADSNNNNSSSGSNSTLHTDYVRCLDGSPVSSDVFVTGSYDHTIKLWDSRQSTSSNKCLFTFQHHAPVQQCAFTASGAMMIAAAGNELYVWDVLNMSSSSSNSRRSGKGTPQQVLHKFGGHQKDVSGFCLDRQHHNRLLSCALDGHVKVFDLMSMQVVHGLRYPDPLVSIALSQDSRKLIIGHVNGKVSCRTRSADGGVKVPAAITQQRRTQEQIADSGEWESIDAGTAEDGGAMEESSLEQQLQTRHYHGAGAAVDIVNSSATFSTSSSSGKKTSSSSSVAVLETERMTRLRPYEVLLKKFQYQAALDSALRTRNPVIVITILEELCRRSGLAISLSGRDDEAALEPLLSFIVRYVAHPRYSRVLVQVAHKVLDIYYHHASSAAATAANSAAGSAAGHNSSSGRPQHHHQYSDAIDELFYKLYKQVRQELHFQKQIMRVMGSLEAVIGAAGVLRQQQEQRADEES